jgi:hypothetical protein
MKKNLIVVSMLMVALLISGVAMAETVTGKVVSADAATSTLKINKSDATGTSEEVSLKVSADTKYSGVSAFDELKEGAQVSAEVEKDEATGDWKATSVNADEAEAAAAPVAE